MPVNGTLLLLIPRNWKNMRVPRGKCNPVYTFSAIQLVVIQTIHALLFIMIYGEIKKRRDAMNWRRHIDLVKKGLTGLLIHCPECYANRAELEKIAGIW